MRFLRKTREEIRCEDRFAWIPVHIVYSPTASVWVWLEFYRAKLDHHGNEVGRCEL